MAELTVSSAMQKKLGSTMRRDAWWLAPLATATVLAGFGIYSTWAAFQGAHYEWGPYLSPFYSPLILANWWPLSPAILILWMPLGFRATCYYYRKAYYRSFFLRPPACAVTGLQPGSYTGERAFPLILQNVHRYFLYLALIVLAFLWHDVILAFNFNGKFGVGLGTLVLLTNTILLSLYTFSCHSLRYLVGGHIDCFSCALLGKARYQAWWGVSVLNRHHMLWAWMSLVMVGFADFYVRMLSMGIFSDVRFF
jgi:hypothetical protein